MSDYDYDDRRSRRHGGGRSRVPEYIETEETYITKGSGNRDMVLRQRDRGVDYYDRPRRARSSGYDRDYYDQDDYSDYSPRSRRGRRFRDDDSYYSDYDRPRERRKSRVGEVIEDLGLGGVVAAVTGRSRSRRRRSSGGSDRSLHGRSRSRETRKKWQQAAQAAVITGVIEAVRSRNTPGPWTGEKGQRVATAALSAAGIDGFLDRDPDRKSKRHIVESVIGGLVTNRVANGSSRRSASRGRSVSRSRSRSVIDRVRSRSRSLFGGRSASRDRDRSASRGRSSSVVGKLAAAGGLAGAAAIGKSIIDRVRSKSRGRDQRRGRSRSIDSEDSYVPSRQQQYGRSRGGPDREYGASKGEDQRGRSAEQGPDGAATRARSDSSSSVSTEDLERERRKTRTKELLTAGLATVATIHAAHGVYNSMVASEKRRQLVKEGEMSPEEARKRKSKNMLQDAAAVGIAALGIKSAFSEWKEMNESRKEKHQLEARRRRHLKARERREREMQQQQQQQQQHGGYNYGYNQYPPGPGYGDANPYQAYAGNLPPPPVGGPPR